MTKYFYPNLKDNQKELLNIIDNIIINNTISKEEKKLFVIAKRDIERGRDFDAQISELISSLQYLVHSSPVLYFLEESRKRMLVNPGTGGSPYGWSNFESKQTSNLSSNWNLLQISFYKIMGMLILCLNI